MWDEALCRPRLRGFSELHAQTEYDEGTFLYKVIYAKGSLCIILES